MVRYMAEGMVKAVEEVLKEAPDRVTAEDRDMVGREAEEGLIPRMEVGMGRVMTSHIKAPMV
jgi:hypothetical protein